jgi:hypothetical protein
MFHLLLCTATYADLITLKNGDRLTGSVIKSDTKSLTLKYFAATVAVPWEEVNSISSETPLNLTLKGGQLLSGPVTTEEGKFAIDTSNAGRIITTKDAVEIIRSKDEEESYERELERLRNPGLLDLWKGYFDTGLAGTRGNARTTTINLGLNAARTTRRDKTNVYVTSLYSTNSTTGEPLTTANAVRGVSVTA